MNRTAEDVIRDKDRSIVSMPADATVRQALQSMAAQRVGAMLVTRNGAIVGIWTERDLMHDTLRIGFDPDKTELGDVMSSELISASHTDSLYEIMDKFLGLRIRHLLIEKDGGYIGLLTPGDVMKASLQEKSDELESLNHLVSWEYYEEWKWDGAPV